MLTSSTLQKELVFASISTIHLKNKFLNNRYEAKLSILFLAGTPLPPPDTHTFFKGEGGVSFNYSLGGMESKKLKKGGAGADLLIRGAGTFPI